MAKERMITRTIEVTTYSVMTLDIETAEARVIDYKITGTVNTDRLNTSKNTMKQTHLNWLQLPESIGKPLCTA